jgi:DNA polymerase III delta prime subunit
MNPYEPFIFKYKPKILNDFLSNNNLKELINSYINIDELNIILLGDSGSGKTTLIECILKEYYKDNILDCDILVINSLKEQGITFYRNEVKNFCQTITLSNKKKTIIIDDIDSINEQCQQVFRNYIDKYNNNINVIMSCSNIHKIIDTLKSRISILKIDSINKNIIDKIVSRIVCNEKIKLEDSVKEKLYQISNYSIRNIINYLEKIKLYNKSITEENLYILCSNISYFSLENYTKLCIENKFNESLKILYNFYNIGYTLMDIYDEYFIYIKYSNILNNKQKIIINKILCKYISIFYNIHEDPIELAFFNKEIIQDIVN